MVETDGKINKKSPELKSGINTLHFSKFEAIKQNLKKEANKKDEAKKNLSLENFELYWQEYQSNHNSNSVKSALQNVKFEISESIIKVFVPTNISKDIILQEIELIEGARKKFGTQNLIFDLNVDRNYFPDLSIPETKNKMSNSELFEYMNEINPKIKILISKLGLKPEDQSNF